jgi:carbon starvation protein
VGNYLPKGNYLLVALSVIIMTLMVIVFVGTFRKWIQLLHMEGAITDEFGDKVLVTVHK